MPQDFRDMPVWQNATALVTEVYKATESFPNDEKFGLTSQLRRAAISIPSNISEGCGRNTAGQQRQFLGYAKGSACEVETQLIIATNLGYIKDPQPLMDKLNAVATGVNDLLDHSVQETSKGRKRVATVRAILLY